MSDQDLQWYKNTMRLIEAAKGRENDEPVKDLYQGWIEDIEKINEGFPGIKERYERQKAMFASFTREQIDHICYQIGDWYCEWERKMWVDGKPNQHWLGVAKEQLNKDLSDPFIDFIESTKKNCDYYDRSNRQYLNRWQNERFLLFRFHRGGLDESMETVTIIDSFEHLIVLINDFWDAPLSKITIEPYVYDERIKWDTQLVIVHVGDRSYPVGYLNKKPEWSVKDYE